MPRKKKEVLFPDYVRVRYPDMEVLGMLTQKAIGKNRSLTEFAADCGLAPSTISRVINGKFQNPISDGIIAAIAKNADPESGVTLEDLLAVHGLAPITLVNEGKLTPLDESKPYVKPKEEPETRYTHSLGRTEALISFDTTKIAKAIEIAYRESQGDIFARTCQETIQNALIECGYSVQLHKDFDIVDLPQFRYRVPFAITTDAVQIDGLNLWAFEIHDGARYTLVQKLSWLFGAAYLNSTSERGIKVSIITTDKEEMTLAKEKFEDVTIPDCVSVILIDLAEKAFVEEFQIKQIHAESHPSVFETDTQDQ